jgi:hypothetical protein
MSEWWTYRLSDFLMFSPRSYHRLFELMNAEFVAVLWLALAAGACVLVALATNRAHAATLTSVVLALAWCWVGWAFHWQRFATINWAAAWFAIGFAVEGALWALCAAGGASQCRPSGPARALGLGLWLVALALHPVIGVLLGRPWSQAQTFGMAPDPTVLATLGALLLVTVRGAGPPTRLRRALGVTLWIVPLTWCAIGGATLWTLHAPEAWLLPAAGALAVLAAATRKRGWPAR